MRKEQRGLPYSDTSSPKWESLRSPIWQWLFILAPEARMTGSEGFHRPHSSKFMAQRSSGETREGFMIKRVPTSYLFLKDPENIFPPSQTNWRHRLQFQVESTFQKILVWACVAEFPFPNWNRIVMEGLLPTVLLDLGVTHFILEINFQNLSNLHNCFQNQPTIQRLVQNAFQVKSTVPSPCPLGWWQ